MIVADIVKAAFPAILAFVIGVGLTPTFTNFLYAHRMWKKKAGKGEGVGGGGTPIFNELHKEKEVGTPRLGGMLIWVSASLTALLIWTVSFFLPSEVASKLDFISRSQTWIPLAALVIGGLIGLVDDLMEIRGSGDRKAGGLSLSKRLAVVAVLGLVCGWWFYEKLGVSTIGLPVGELALGWLLIPLFAVVMLAVYSGGVIDGIDGLAGGIFATMFSAYAAIAFYQQQIDLAALCLSLVGAILAFLWFNIPPARFYMSETGTMGLTMTLAIVAFMTDSLAGGKGLMVLPIIAFPLLITTLSVIIQVCSKKFLGRKVFLVAPVHHHFEALGWPSYKVTMRYWVLGIVVAITGAVLAIVA
jgi:phospho-N-acetylmuramoyl-pentapeptide-transferase